MGYHAPTKAEKAPDPLINLGETSADVQNQKNKKGFLSSFLQGSRNRSGGFLSNAFNQIQKQQGTLGSSAV